MTYPDLVLVLASFAAGWWLARRSVHKAATRYIDHSVGTALDLAGYSCVVLSERAYGKLRDEALDWRMTQAAQRHKREAVAARMAPKEDT